MENLEQKTDFTTNDIVLYDGESYVVVDVEENYLWIRNVMDQRTTHKVKKEDVTAGGGYGETGTSAQEKSSVILESTGGLSQYELTELKRLTAQITGKTLREITNLRLPLA